jgi:hypothetical protein
VCLRKKFCLAAEEEKSCWSFPNTCQKKIKWRPHFEEGGNNEKTEYYTQPNGQSIQK